MTENTNTSSGKRGLSKSTASRQEIDQQINRRERIDMERERTHHRLARLFNPPRRRRQSTTWTINSSFLPVVATRRGETDDLIPPQEVRRAGTIVVAVDRSTRLLPCPLSLFLSLIPTRTPCTSTCVHTCVRSNSGTRERYGGNGGPDTFGIEKTSVTERLILRLLLALPFPTLSATCGIAPPD